MSTFAKRNIRENAAFEAALAAALREAVAAAQTRVLDEWEARHGVDLSNRRRKAGQHLQHS
eukprot:56938-Chlamydomonas_euryale.AAC.1